MCIFYEHNTIILYCGETSLNLLQSYPTTITIYDKAIHFPRKVKLFLPLLQNIKNTYLVTLFLNVLIALFKFNYLQNLSKI